MARHPRAAAALGVAALCALALLAAGCASLKQIGAGVHSPAGKTYAITAHVTTVTVTTAGSVTVTGSAGAGHVTVTEEPSYSTTPPAATRTVSGTTLHLGYACKAQLVCSVDYAISLPRGVAVSAQSRAGSVTLTSLSGAVTARTFAGLISATGLTSPTASLTSSAGGINAAFTAAPASLRASTKAGSITISVPGSDTYNVAAHAVVGETTVTVRHSAAAAHVITAHSDLGSITISPS